jgi:hypothetical protein
MASTPILFLDFDGVVHPDGCDIDLWFCHLPLLEPVLREFPQLEVVVSSSWGQSYPFDELIEFFPDHMKPRIVGAVRGGLRLVEDKIPSELWNYVREAECYVWIRDNRPGAPWIALEDQAWRFAPASPNVIMIDGKTGITRADVEQLRQRLHALTSTQEKEPQ